MRIDVTEHWLQVIADKLNRVIELGEKIEQSSRSKEIPQEWGEHDAERSDNLRVGIARQLEGYRLVNDGDVGKIVEVQNSLAEPWRECTLLAIDWDRRDGFLCRQSGTVVSLRWRFARIKIDDPAKEPPKKWRILHPGESVRSSDWENEDLNSETDPPDGPGWRPVSMCKNGRSVLRDDKCIYARPVADEPAKEPGHRAGPKPDPGEGYRLLSKEPLEELQPGDEHELSKGKWVESANARTHRVQGPGIWYRRKIETPKPAWEPKVGGWVLVTRPENWKEWKEPLWQEEMHQYEGKVLQVSGAFETSFGHRVKLHGIDWFFHRDWLSPAEPPEPEYREPVLPADACKECQFSDDGIHWRSGWLNGWVHRSHQWISHSGGHWRHCRIKKES